MKRDEILEDLKALEVLMSIEYREDSADFWSHYPQIENVGYYDASFSHKGSSYTLRLCGNQVTKRLYFSLYDSGNQPIIIYQPVISYPHNLVFGLGFSLFFFENKLYYKDNDK